MRNLKRCVVCGAAFAAPPSSKKITCSPACSAKRKAAAHAGVRNAWSPEARARLAEARRRAGYSPSARRGLQAAMALPESRRGPQNRAAKTWTLIAPDGARHRVTNLQDWARRHAEWFDTPAPNDPADRERIARNIRAGFGQILLSMNGRRKKPCCTYKGWRLGAWPKGR